MFRRKGLRLINMVLNSSYWRLAPKTSLIRNKQIPLLYFPCISATFSENIPKKKAAP